MVVAVLDRDDAAARAVAAETGGLAVVADVTSPQAVERAVNATLARFDHIDLLVNNAGIAWTGPALDMPLDTLQAMLRVNVEGVFIVSRTVLPHMIARRSGSIVNLASWAGKTGAAYFAGYSATKFAVIGLTQSLAREMAPHGIRVNAICPGFFPSKMSSGLLETISASVIERTPLGRLGGDSDLMGAAVYLASDASRHVTGQYIAVDGGASSI